MYQYVVSAQKPTNVTHVLKGHFLSEKDLNLIVVKSTLIEFHTLAPEGLMSQFELGIYGRVATCELYKPQGEARELLFVSTERRQYFVLSYNAEQQKVVTKATGEITTRINRPNENGQIGIIDPDGRVIGLNLYQGQFDVIPMDAKGQLKESFNIRLEEINVIDIQFLHGYQVPTICVLYEDNRNNRNTRHIKTYGISTKDMEFIEGPWSQPNVDLETNMIIPIPEPAGGVLIMGLETIAYRNGRAGGRTGQAGTSIAIPVRCGLIRASAPIDADGRRWLLCDEWGGLHVLALQVDTTRSAEGADGADGAAAAAAANSSSSSSSSSSSNAAAVVSSSNSNGSVTVVDLTMEFLGETSIASCLAYLDNGFVFVGSSFADSQLIRLSPEKNRETDSYIEVVQNCTNLGPIVDFCVVDLDRQGQGQVVTCSGGFKDGSLRVVRNGIGIDEQAAVELPGIKALWSLRGSFASKWDQYLVQTFVGETRILSIEDEDLCESEIGGFDTDDMTLCCANMIGDLLLQVTSKEARLVKCDDISKVHARWSPPDGQSITIAHANASQVILALRGGELYLFALEDGQLEQKGHRTFKYEIACINISPLHVAQSPDGDGDDKMEDQDGEPLSTDVAAVGLWTDVSIRVLALPTLEEIHCEKLGVETIPRSLCFVTLEGSDHLLVGMGDGKLFTFSFLRGGEKDKLLAHKKKIALGSRPISLSKFRTKDSMHIFAGTDRPTVIYSSGTKLLYSNVNQREVTTMVSFNTESFPDCLALASEEDLTIGTINEIQKLHIRSHPLGEQPRRICHQKSSHTFGLCTIRSGTGVFRATASRPTGDDAAVVSHGADAMETDGPSGAQDEQPDMVETSYVRLLDDMTFETLDSFQLDEFETGCSIICCKFEDVEGSGSAPKGEAAGKAPEARGTAQQQQQQQGDQAGQAAAASSSSSSSSSSAAVTAAPKADGGAAEGDLSASSPAGAAKKGGDKDKDKEFIVVGTAYAIEGEQEPNKGRILVFEVSNKEVAGEGGGRGLLLVAEKQTRGAVYCLNSFNGKLLAGINSKVKLFSFADRGPDQSELVAKCGHHEHILALYIQSRGDFIVVGDLMKSVSLLVYRALDDTIEEIARDYTANWMTAVGICDDDMYIGAETHMNLFTVQKNSEAPTEEARHMLRVVGEYHLGEFVNRFHHGSLVMLDSQQETHKREDVAMTLENNPAASDPVSETLSKILSSTPKPQMLFGTVNGVIGVVASLTDGQYKLLKRVEQALSEVIRGVGGLSHAAWRSFSNDRKQAAAHGFVDGDLIEAFLDLGAEDAQAVLDRVNGKVPMKEDDGLSSILVANAGLPASDQLTLNLNVETMTRFIEDLARLH